MQRFITTSLLLFACNFLFAQLVEMPSTTNPVLRQYAKTHPQQANSSRQANDTLTLPFLDDFTYEGPYPDSMLWLDNQAYVNPSLGLNSPSLGVATLDGLDPYGLPYGGIEGWSDTLTSKPIDLSDYTASDNIYMSFFAQPQGRGDAPEAIDVLVLEFKNSNGIWQEMEEISGDTASTFTFYPYFLGTPFISNDFQFRFINFSARTGFIDLWHIDYVYINTGRLQSDESIEDVCFTRPPHSILREYTAMPWIHYYFDPSIIAAESWAGIDMEINNLGSQSHTLSDAYYTADDQVYDENVMSWNNGSSISIPANTKYDVSGSLNLNTDLTFGPLIAQNPTQTKINTTYYYTVTGQDVITNQTDYILKNDTAVTETIFGNYFAYDDGIAESNIGVNGSGSQVAVKFRANVDDSLKAIQIHVPYIAGNVGGQFFSLKVWENNLTGNPVRELSNLTPEQIPDFNGFATYEINPPVFMTANTDYYIGWEQVSNTSPPIPVGFDKNNLLATDNNFYSVGGSGWVPFADAGIEGALMIRAVTTEGTVFVNNEEIRLADEIADIFPNPVRDQLSVDLKTGAYQDFDLTIYNTSGQLLLSQNLTKFIPVYHLTPGIYFIKLQDKTTKQVYHHKFIKN